MIKLFLSLAAIGLQADGLDKFYVIEQPLSLVSTFEVATEEGLVGRAERDVFALRTNFQMRGADPKWCGRAKTRLLNWGLIADVEDGEGNQIGAIEEDLWRLYYWPSYNIYNGRGELVARAEMEPLEVEFRICDAKDDGRVLAKIERPLIAPFRDWWTVSICDPGTADEIDLRLFIFLAMYQTSKYDR